MSDFLMQILINFVQSFEGDLLGEMGMFLGPILEDKFKIGANPSGFLLQFLDIADIIEKKFDGVSGDHEIEYQIFILRLVAGNANNIPNLLRILCDKFVFDVPVGLPDHVCEEDGLDLVEQEDLGDGFENFIDGVAEGDVAVAGDGPEDGYHPTQLAFAVGVEGFAVAGGDVALVFLFIHQL